MLGLRRQSPQRKLPRRETSEDLTLPPLPVSDSVDRVRVAARPDSVGLRNLRWE
ncbi:hypothetical protein LINPERHAP2_LOCUS44530 [Linum perenne]